MTQSSSKKIINQIFQIDKLYRKHDLKSTFDRTKPNSTTPDLSIELQAAINDAKALLESLNDDSNSLKLVDEINVILTVHIFGEDK